MNNQKRSILVTILICVTVVPSVLLRLYRVSGPIADWHSFRQADTAAVARNFLKFGFDPLRPRSDDLSNIQSGFDNPNGWRMVEFPLYQITAAGLARISGILPIEIWLRLVTIAVSAATGVIVGFLTWELAGGFAGIAAAVMFAVLPYGMYYGRTILPEPFMVFLSVTSLWILMRALKGRIQSGLILLSAVIAAAALLVKPTAVFLLLPVLVLIIRRLGLTRTALLYTALYAVISFLPVLLWRDWIQKFPEGIPVYTWLFNEGGIRFKGAWFWWLFGKRIAELILGYWGIVPLAMGIIVKPDKNEGWFFRMWLIGGLLYLIIIASGNVRHDYYQILLLPVLCVYLAKGYVFLLTQKSLNRIGALSVSCITFLFMLSFSWYTIRTYYWVNRPEIVEAGRAADSLLPEYAKVIAPYNGDTAFLYQINRQGWPLGFDIEEKIAMGATHYVTVSPTDSDLETKDLSERFTVLLRNEKFAIIDLTTPKK
jgi:hypothetical protein